MNYTELVNLIQQYTDNDETTFVANIPTFVKLAEEKIYRYVKLPKLRKVSTAVVSTSTQYITAPSDFLTVDSLEVASGSTYSHLIPKEANFLSEAYPSTAATGTPKYYALLDENTIQIAPTTDGSYNVRLQYTCKPVSIVTDGTSWIGDNCENALLYGSLLEAYTYLKGEPDLMSLYENRFMEAVGRAKIVGEGKSKTDEWRTAPQVVQS